MRFIEKTKTNLPCITFETADPAKFPDEIQKILGINPVVPPTLKEVQEKEEIYLNVKKDYLEFKKLLLNQFCTTPL